MALHVSSKLCAVGCVVALLIMAFGSPRSLSADQPRLKIPTEQALAPQLADPLRRLANRRLEPVTDALKTPVDVSVAPAAEVKIAELEADTVTPSDTLLLRSTAYNSLEAQTDSTPFITSTGERTRFGIIAVSRDLLAETQLPYGSLVRLTDLGHYYNGRNLGEYQALLDSQGLFIVEDTMHPRKQGQIDVWFPEYNEAVQWGVRQVRVEVIRRGREDGEILAAVGGD